MAMIFNIEAGEQATVGQVKIEGDPELTQEQVLQITRLKPGSRVRSDRLTRALARLRQHYQRNDHLEALVSLTDRIYHDDSNTLDYVFEVDAGKRVVITTAGHNVSNRTLRRLVPVFQENAVDDDLLYEGCGIHQSAVPGERLPRGECRCRSG